jgi:hypothetical protein
MRSGPGFVALALVLVACGHAAHPADTASSPAATGAGGAKAKPPDGDASPLAAASGADAAAPVPVAAASDAGAPPASAGGPSSAPVFETPGPKYPAASLREVFEKNQAKLLACFEAGRKKVPKLRGHVNVKFAIGQDGKASGVQDQGSNLPDPKVVACVVKLVKTLRFPKPEGGVTVVYPFIFHSTEPLLILPDTAP